MQIITETRKITAEGMQASRAFTVKAGAHIMTVLSGLYTDPKDAMVREYLTNMYDAYLMLAKSLKMTMAEFVASPMFVRPVFSVPTSLSPELVFRDNGIGMDMETVWNVYTSYGESTKNADNDAVGGFGLGSKTAFCYNGGATWTVEARKDGQSHLFMAAIGTDSVPRLDHVRSMETTEHSGVTVRIPIRRQDIDGVIRAAEKYLPYFPIPITVEGMPAPKALDYTFNTDAWGVSPNQRRRDGLTVIMGNVPYPVSINIGDLAPRAVHHHNYEVAYFFAYNRIDLFLPVGSVDIVPSRDALKYTDRTVAAIRDALARVHKELPDVTAKKLASCTTEWQAMTQLAAMNTLQYFEAVVPRVKWNGMTVDPAVGVTRDRKKFLALDPTMTMTMIGTTDGDRSTITELTTDKIVMRAGEHTVVVRDDMPKGAIGATKALLFARLIRKTAAGRAARYGHSVGHAVLVKSTKLTDAQIQDFFGGMPASHIILASTLTGYKVPASVRGLSKDTLYRYAPLRDRWEARVNIPTTEKTYYFLPLEKNHYNRYDVAPGVTMFTVLEAARSLKVVDATTVVYGIKSTEVGNFDKAVWKNLLDVVDAAARTFVTNNLDLMKLINCDTQRNDAMMLIDLTDRVWKISGTHPLLEQAVQTFAAAKGAHQNHQVKAVSNLASMDDKFNKWMRAEIAKSKVMTPEQSTELVYQKFPMLAVLSHLWANGYRHSPPTQHKQTVLAYLKSVC